MKDVLNLDRGTAGQGIWLWDLEMGAAMELTK